MASKILLVEDDNNLREIYEARLQAEGYTIATAKDGEEALVAAKAEKPDLIISDVMMPRISGFEMLDILRNTDELKYTKVIMLTALGQADDKTRADSLGADRYLVKSQVTLEDIVKAAHELTDGPVPTAATSSVSVIDNTTIPLVQATTQPVSVATPPALIPQPVTMQVAMPPTNPVPAPIAPQVPAESAPGSAPAASDSAYAQPSSVQVSPAPPTTNQQMTSSFMPSPLSPATQPNPIVIEPPTASAAETVTNTPTVLAEAQPTADRPAFMTDFSSTTASRLTTPIAPEQTSIPAKERPVDIINAASTAEEEATIGAQIAEFANTPAPTVERPVPPPSQNETDATATAHDAVLANAMDNLTNGFNTVSTTPVVAPTNSTSSVQTPPTEVLSSNIPAIQGSVTIANKKIIQPIKSDPRPDLNKLLAREEAKDTMAMGYNQVVTSSLGLNGVNGQDNPQTSTPMPQPDIMTNPTIPSAQLPASDPLTPTPNDFDPNNIAL